MLSVSNSKSDSCGCGGDDPGPGPDPIDSLSPWEICFKTNTIDWEHLSPGDTDITAHGVNIQSTETIMIFDSGSPTLGYENLGSPNENAPNPGPGEGADGEPTGAGPNNSAQGNVLIISNEPPTPLLPTPAASGSVYFDFEHGILSPTVGFLNVTAAGTMSAYNAANTLLATTPIPALGENSFQSIELPVVNARRLVITLTSASAISTITYKTCGCGLGPCETRVVENFEAFGTGTSDPSTTTLSVTTTGILTRAAVFDSANPTLTQEELGTPNDNAPAPGPGSGSGGEPGQTGENLFALGKIVVISLFPVLPSPLASLIGGTLRITFANPVVWEELTIVNSESDGSSLRVYDDSSVLLTTIPVPNLGENSVLRIVNTTSALVKSLELETVGRLGIDNVRYVTCNDGGGGGGGSNITAYSILSNRVSVTNTSWQTIGYMPWLQSRHGSYTSGVGIIHTSYTDRELDVRIRNETLGITLGSISGIATSDTLSFPITLPVANANIELQVQKSAILGVSPHILGCTLEFE